VILFYRRPVSNENNETAAAGGGVGKCGWLIGGACCLSAAALGDKAIDICHYRVGSALRDSFQC